MARIAPTRTALMAVTTVATLIAASTVACSGGDSTGVEAVAPDAVASAVGDITSGWIQLSVDSASVQSTSELRFDGGDSSLSSTMELVGDNTVDEDTDHGEQPSDAAVRSITVDGTTYSDASLLLSLPGDQETSGGGRPTEPIDAAWISQPAIEPPEGAGEPMLTDPLGSMAAVLHEVVIDQPGEPIEIDGVAATRNRIQLSGGDASELAADLGLYSGGDSLTDLAERYPDAARRFGTVQDYLDAHSEATVVVDLDGSGQLVRAEVMASVDVDEYPRCALFGIETSQIHLVLDEINQAQDIEAPPDEDVITWEEFARRQGFEVPPMPGVPGSATPDPDTPGVPTAPEVPETTDLGAMPTTTFGGPDGGLPDDVQAGAAQLQQQMIDEMLDGCPT